MNKKLTENPIKKFARRMLREGEIENAEAALAAKDQVDRLQDMIEEVGKMSNDELPKLTDKIRGSFGADQATAYQQAASTVLTDLLTTLKEKKTALEQAVLVLTGDATAEAGAKTDMALPDEEPVADAGEDVSGDELTDFSPEAEAPGKKTPAPLGREPRFPTEESRKFNKKLSEAKIVALKKALDETDSKKFPVRARRLAEELRRVAIIAIKEEAKAKKMKNDCDNVKTSSKTMMKPVSEGKSTECKGCGNSLVGQMSKNMGHCQKCAKAKGMMTVPDKKKKVKEASDVPNKVPNASKIKKEFKKSGNEIKPRKLKENSDHDSDAKFKCGDCGSHCENNYFCAGCGNSSKGKFSPLSKIKN